MIKPWKFLQIHDLLKVSNGHWFACKQFYYRHLFIWQLFSFFFFSFSFFVECIWNFIALIFNKSNICFDIEGYSHLLEQLYYYKTLWCSKYQDVKVNWSLKLLKIWSTVAQFSFLHFFGFQSIILFFFFLVLNKLIACLLNLYHFFPSPLSLFFLSSFPFFYYSKRQSNAQRFESVFINVV